MTGQGFHQQELTYWRDRARDTEARLETILDVFNDRHNDRQLPPEPPVGTTYLASVSRAVIWERRDDGWHYVADAGPTHPEPWAEIASTDHYDTAIRVLPDEPGWEPGEAATNATLDEVSAAWR